MSQQITMNNSPKNCIRKTVIIFAISLIWLFFLNLHTAQAVTRISINQGISEPVPVAINDFESNDKNISRQIEQIVIDDLDYTGYFRIAPDSLFLETVAFNSAPDFSYWSKIDYPTFVNAAITKASNSLEVEIKIWSNDMQKIVKDASFAVPKKDIRRAAHKIADIIYEQLTGDKGYFDSKVAYIKEVTQGKRRTTKVAIADYDGKNIIELTNGKNLVLHPQISPNGENILYVTYDKRIPKIYSQKLQKGSVPKLMGEFSGMSFAPRFNPEGDKAAFSISKDGSTFIYEVNFNTGKLRRLTYGGGRVIETSPSYSPSGDKITFCSDRGGNPQIYVMDLHSGKVEKISFGDGVYSAPSWSPRGDMIAFIKQQGNQFFIGVIAPDGSGERLLTSSWFSDTPTWAPNGRAIMFNHQDKGRDNCIYIVDITGTNLKKFAVPSAAASPCWIFNKGK